MNLKDRVVVLTGASSGIGKAAALLFAEKGANLVLAARRPDALEKTAAECRMMGVEVLPVPTDVASEQDVAQLAHRAVERFGRIDVWVNDAGVYLVAPFEEAPMDVYRRVMETNYFGVVNGSLEAVKQFRKQGDAGEGVLINVSSLDGKVAMPYVTAYVASKHAVRGFDESLEQELLDTNIKICTIMPGPVDTPLFGHAANFMGKRLRPPPPVYDPEKVARTIVGCAERPRHEISVGGVTKLMGVLHSITPSFLFARGSKTYADRGQFTDESAPQTPGNVIEPVNDGSAIHGGWRKHSSGINMAPVLLAVPAGFAAWFWLRSRGRRKGGMMATAAGMLTKKNVKSVVKSNRVQNARRALKGAKLPDVRHALDGKIDRKRVEARVANVRHALDGRHLSNVKAVVNGRANGKGRLSPRRVLELIRR